MATRCNIDAVQQRTSPEVHMSHSSGPKVHRWATSYTAPNGITKQATSKSATASDKISWLAALRKCRSSSIAAITNTLPVIVPY